MTDLQAYARLTGIGGLLLFVVYFVNLLIDAGFVPFSGEPIGSVSIYVLLLIMSALITASLLIREHLDDKETFS